MHWLFEAKKRFGISVLNYIVTSNHIHLLVRDICPQGDISQFMQLMQSRTAQEFNKRKNRKGAYWEDRYHATAISSDDHLIRCMTYINLNMVRAGVVKHPIDWEESGFYEIAYPKRRYSIIDFDSLMEFCNIHSIEELQKHQELHVQDAIEKKCLSRESKWTEAIAIGSPEFLEKIKNQMDIKAKSRSILKSEDDYLLLDQQIPYNDVFDAKNMHLSLKNDHF
jgi:REP element-mobilizing transposase RayT